MFWSVPAPQAGFYTFATAGETAEAESGGDVIDGVDTGEYGGDADNADDGYGDGADGEYGYAADDGYGDEADFADAVSDGSEGGANENPAARDSGETGASGESGSPGKSGATGSSGTPGSSDASGTSGVLTDSNDRGVSGVNRESPSFRQAVAVGASENDVSVYPQAAAESMFDNPGLEDMDADAYILIERRTGQTICSKNAEKRLYPASTSKIMTAILAIEMGDMDAVMTASPRAVRDVGTDGSNIGIIAGEKMRLDNLLDALMVRSANEAANIIAENLCDTRDEYIALMNKKAKELGAHDTNFTNTSGIHETTHYTTAFDLAKIANYAMDNAAFRKIVAQRNIILTPTNKHASWESMNSTNSMLSDDKIKGFKVTGIKTGYHSDAGYCMVASGIDNNDMELLCVVLGVRGGEAGTSAKRFKIASDLLSYGFTNFQMNTVIRDNETAGTISVLGGENLDTVDALSDGTIKLFLPVEQENWNVSRIEYIKSEVAAPVTSGDAVGYIEFRNAGYFAGRVNLIAAADVPALKGSVRSIPNRGDTGSARSALSLAAGGAGTGTGGNVNGNAGENAETGAGKSNKSSAGFEWAPKKTETNVVSAIAGSIDFASIMKGAIFVVIALITLISVLRTFNMIRRNRKRAQRAQYHGRLDYPPVRGIYRKRPKKPDERIKYDMPGTRRRYGNSGAARRGVYPAARTRYDGENPRGQYGEYSTLR